jgi:hypothetical protein
MPLSFAERQECKKHFETYDHDGNGNIDVKELTAVMKSLGDNPTESQVKTILAEVDTNKDGNVSFDEFVHFVEKFRAGNQGGKFGEVFTKNAAVNVIASATGQHTFSDEEKASFTDHINSVLKNDKDLSHLNFPLNPDSMDLFNAVKDGILLCKLINTAVKGTIDERAINKGKGLNTFKVTENQNLVVNSAKAIGCSVVNIGANDLIEAKVHLVLGLIWQIIRIGLLSAINLKNHPYLIRLLEPGETLEDLLKLSPEQILLRWVNFHLKAAGSSRRVHNFSGDIKDSEVYTILLNQLAPKQCDKRALQESNTTKRAEIVLDNADKINCRKFLRPKDIVNGNGKLNLAFVANLFNTIPGLEPVEEVIIIDEETREEKAFRNWMNSLGVDPYVNNLYEDLRNGIVILQLEDMIQPGIVDWSKVNTKMPLNKFKEVENCNYAVVVGKALKFSLVGIGGTDLQAGNKKLTLAVIWQCMRLYILNFLKRISKSGKEITEEDIIRWANDKVKSSGKSRQIREFKDKELSDSLYIFDLLAACQSESINMSLVSSSNNEAEKIKNAQYAISCARKMGATVFLLPDDIVEVNPKMMMTFFGGIMAVFGN